MIFNKIIHHFTNEILDINPEDNKFIDYSMTKTPITNSMKNIFGTFDSKSSDKSNTDQSNTDEINDARENLIINRKRKRDIFNSNNN